MRDSAFVPAKRVRPETATAGLHDAHGRVARLNIQSDRIERLGVFNDETRRTLHGPAAVRRGGGSGGGAEVGRTEGHVKSELVGVFRRQTRTSAVGLHRAGGDGTSSEGEDALTEDEWEEEEEQEHENKFYEAWKRGITYGVISRKIFRMAKSSTINKKTSRSTNKKTPLSKGKKEIRKKQAPLSAEELDRQLFSYMGESGKRVVLDDQLDTYFKTAAE